MKKILIVLFIFAFDSGPLLYANTYEDIVKKANEFTRKGKILAEIDVLLKKRNLETMTPNEYSYLTTWAAIKLQEIGKCQQAIDELKKLDKSYLKKISGKDRLIRFTDKYRVIALCGGDASDLKYIIDNWKKYLPHSLYAEILSDYGKRLENDTGVNKDIIDATYYYGKSIGEVLAYRGRQYPMVPIQRAGEFLSVNHPA